MKIVDANKCGVLELGYAGEKNRTQVRFYYGDLAEEFPGGAVIIQVKRPGEETKYDLLPDLSEEGYAVWNVSEYDCGIRGFGECQFIYATNNNIAKAKVWKTHVDRSIEGDNASIPPDWQDIEAALLEAAGHVYDTIETVRELVEEAHDAAQASADSARESADAAVEAQHATEEALDAITRYRDEVVEITEGVQEEGARQIAAVAATGAERVTQVQNAITQVGNRQVENVTTAGNNQVTLVKAAGQTQTQEVHAAGTTQVSNVVTAGNTQVSAVNTAGATHLAAIDAAGNTKVTAITNEGNAQIAAIEAKGQETLDDIPETYTELNNAVKALQEDLAGFVNSVELGETQEGDTALVVTDGDGNETVIQIATKGMAFNGGYVDTDNYLHLTMDGDDIEGFTPFVLPAGGGGGGGGAGYVTITRITDAAVDCVYGNSMPIRFNFSATDSGGDVVGNGTGTWSVGGIVVARNVIVRQGDNSFDISPYLTAGSNSIRLSVSVDTGGSQPQTATKTWTVNAVNVYFTWNYDDTQVNTDAFTDRWIPYGDIEKTTHTLIDGETEYTSVTSRSGVQQSMNIPMMSHGAHSIERWITAVVGEETQSTPRQYHQAIFAVAGNTTPIVAVSMPDVTIDQYNTLQIPVVIYDPANLTADATLYIDGVEAGTWTGVDRSLRYWNYTPTTSGTHVLSITCGTTTETLTVTVNAVEIDAEEIGGYSFRFKSSEMATNNAVRNWTSNGVNATFSDNFDWINGGLKTETDESGVLQQYLLIKAGTRMTINHKLFATDPKSNGMNFKMIFKVGNVRNYDAQVGHCYADGVGLRMYANQSVFNSSGTSISVPYGEDEYIEMEFDTYPAPRLENDGNYRYMMAWMDGVITITRVYGANDNFVQSVANQEGIVLGSDDCDLYIYMVKAYPMLITRNDHVDNFIMDAPNAVKMIQRYNRNDILDESGAISYEKLMEKNPDCRVWLYDIPYLTNGKKDKVKNCQFHQFWPNGSAYYEITGMCTMTVQGTSSMKYIQGAANTDSNFTAMTDGYGNDLLAGGTEDETYGNNWFTEDEENPGHAKVYTDAEVRAEAGIAATDTPGAEWVPVTKDSSGRATHYIHALGMKLNDDSCPITYSNVKVNFASCEQVNNMCNAKWYQMYNPYPSLTARDCMEFNMGVQFIKDSGSVPDDSHFVLWGDNKYHMYSIANMGNSKKNVHVFHDLSNPNEVCIEVNDNDKDQMRMVSDDLSAEDWSGDVYFGMRYPDTKNPRQEIRDAWQRLVSWMASRNPGAATGDALSEPETYAPYTFRGHDRTGTQVLRGTTVSQYAGTYTHDTFARRMARMLSECEDYMVMDSFVYHFVYLERHTMVDNVSKNNFWSSTDLLHWDLSKAYDMDTSDGNNNQGQMVFDYGNEYNDDIGGMKVFNGADSVWFVFVANLYEACRTMFTNREAAGAWSATAYHNFLLSEQQKVPERCWIECYWYDYLRTYEQGISTEWMTFLDGGQKTHQRKHFEFFEELYDSSKYRGTASTSQNVNFRAYTPNEWAGVEPKGEITVTMYNKMYISVDVGTTALAPIKAARATPVTIDFSSGGTLNNTLIAINTASMIQAISGMEQLYPDTCVFSAATRLRELTIGSTEEGYENTFLRTLALENNRMLERLYVQNLPNAASVLDLTNCPSLLEVDASGSGFTGYEFADGGLLEEATLERPVSLVLRNLAYLTDENFSVADWTALTTLRHENTPGVAALPIVNAATALQILRLLGIDWELPNGNLLARLYNMQGLDENNYTIPQSVITGEVALPSISSRALALYEAAWSGLDISYIQLIEQYTVSFVNLDGTPITDRQGSAYVQYIDRGDVAYDPVQAGDILAPTYGPDQQYVYTYSGWTGLTGAVTADKTVTAAYDTALRTYTVRFLAQMGDVRSTQTVEYGRSAKYNPNDPYDYPDITDEEGSFICHAFLGWDKSTAYITGDLDVYAIWDRAALPEDGTVALENMTPGQIKAIARFHKASTNWEAQDHFDFELGKGGNNIPNLNIKEFNFSNVESQELISTPTWFDGQTIQRTDIKLFDTDSPSFTLAVDYEFTESTANSTLVSAFSETGYRGFRLRYNGAPNVQWGDANQNIGNGFVRGMLVVRHVKGSKALYMYHSNPQGSYIMGEALGVAANSRTTEPETDAVLCFGAVPLGNTEFDYAATGWIHWAKIWFDDLGVDVCKQLGQWPHEPYRAEYRGPRSSTVDGCYTLTEDTGSRSSADFVPNAPLALLRQMNPTNTNTGGYTDSVLRRIIESRVFDAFPIWLQAIIRQVNVPTNVGGGSSSEPSLEVEQVPSRVYLMSYGEAESTTSEPYASEGTVIPWYTGRNQKVKFPGLIRDDRLIESTSDPTLLFNDIESGTVWSMNNDYKYIYLSPTDAARHKVAGGRNIASPAATGDVRTAQDGNGGVWVRAYYWWLRSPWSTSPSYFANMGYIGNVYGGGYASVSNGVAPGFSI